MTAARLSSDEERALLEVARDAVEAAVLRRAPKEVLGESSGALAENAACFVTLKEQGRLRGCIGTLEARSPLGVAAREMSAGAALRDPRFLPVGPSEVEGLELSVTVLGPPRPLDPPAFRLGRDGLVVSRGHHRGVLLPQVAAEHGWDLRTFLQETCLKAGLPPHAHEDPGTTIEVFSANVYGE